MPRIRTIKPEFWSDAKVASLSHTARLVFIGLWNFADDEGRGRAIPKELNGFLFPNEDIRDAEITKALTALSERGMVQLYEHAGTQYYHVVHWLMHQSVNRPAPSRLPVPPAFDASVIHHGCITDAEVSRAQELGSRNIGTRNAECESSFEEFWKLYPRKNAKPDARRAWLKLRPDEDLRRRIMATVEKQKASPEWTRKAGQYIPYPATYLNGRKWEDEGVDAAVLFGHNGHEPIDEMEEIRRGIAATLAKPEVAAARKAREEREAHEGAT